MYCVTICVMSLEWSSTFLVPCHHTERCLNITVRLLTGRYSIQSKRQHVAPLLMTKLFAKGCGGKSCYHQNFVMEPRDLCNKVQGNTSLGDAGKPQTGKPVSGPVYEPKITWYETWMACYGQQTEIQNMQYDKHLRGTTQRSNSQIVK